MTTRRTTEVLPHASEADSIPRPLRTTHRNDTLRRCWGALKETVDALGAAWDVYDNDAEDPEADIPRRSEARIPSTPVSPKRPSLDIFKTPPSQPLQEPSQSHPSHYDTLAHSPTTSRSSRRKRKMNTRRSTLTSTRRRTHKGDIDHSYSTDEDGSGPHARLLGRLFYQGPPEALDDKACVFACPQAGLMENIKPNVNDGKHAVDFDQPAKPSNSCENPASMDERTYVLRDEIDRASLEQVCSDRSLRDWCPSEASHLGQEDPKPMSPRSAHVALESETQTHDDEMNRSDSRDTRAQHEGRARNVTFSTPVAVPLRQLTERAVSKIPTDEYNMEAWSSSVPRQGDIPTTGLLDGTLPPVEDAVDQADWEIDEWRGKVVPQKAIPSEALLTGKNLPMPHFETRKRRLQRRAASCIIFSAAIPPERDTTDLLTTPLGPWWGPTEDYVPSSTMPTTFEETLMSAFGVACDLGTIGTHNSSLLSSADDVMSRSAALGSMVKLDSADTVVRRRTETASLARLAFADDRNLWWHCVNNARADQGSCWTVMLDMCELPSDFHDDDYTKAPMNWCRDLDRTIYDFYSMHHGDGFEMNIPQKFSVHNYYMYKLELHTRGVWETFMSRWVPDVKTFPPANPFTAAAEAYAQIAIKDHPRSGSMFRRSESAVNALSKYVTCMPKHAWRQKEDRLRFVLDNALLCFAQLVFVRCQAMRFEIYLVKHPEVVVPAQLP